MTASTDLTLEVRDQQNESMQAGGLILTPIVHEDYWAYRVRLSETQAIAAIEMVQRAATEARS